jgi:hypothetical protein
VLNAQLNRLLDLIRLVALAPLLLFSRFYPLDR